MLLKSFDNDDNNDYFDKVVCNNKIKCNYYNHKKYILKIQKVYRGYYIRKKINNIYNKLPDDLQKHIIDFANYDFYMGKRNKTIFNILKNKIDSFNNNYYIIYHTETIDTLMDYIFMNYKYIEYIYKLYKKYKKIIDYFDNNLLYSCRTKKNLIILSKSIAYKVNQYDVMINDAYSMHVCAIADALYFRINLLLFPDSKLSSFS